MVVYLNHVNIVGARMGNYITRSAWMWLLIHAFNMIVVFIIFVNKMTLVNVFSDLNLPSLPMKYNDKSVVIVIHEYGYQYVIKTIYIYIYS